MIGLLGGGLACASEFVVFPLMILAFLIPIALYLLVAGAVFIVASLGLRRRSEWARQVLTGAAAVNGILGLAYAYLSACALYAGMVGASSEPEGGVRSVLLGSRGWATLRLAVWALACCVCYACARAGATKEYCLAQPADDAQRLGLLRG